MPTADTLPLMAHLVLGYPTLNHSLALAADYAAAGVRYIEVQLPFSHPSADGPFITRANQIAHPTLDLAAGIAAVGALAQAHPRSQFVLMSYANKLLGQGSVALLQALRVARIHQLIVPDLPNDSALAALLIQRGFALIPVLAPNTPPQRLAELLHPAPPLVYVMAGYALTGTGYAPDARLHDLVAAIRARCHAPIGIGFGIRTPQDAREVLGLAQFAIVGTALLQAAQAGQHQQWLHSYAQMVAQL